jgi:hypothetical protein
MRHPLGQPEPVPQVIFDRVVRPIADPTGRLAAAGPVDEGAQESVVFLRHLEEQAFVFREIAPVAVNKFGQRLELRMGALTR